MASRASGSGAEASDVELMMKNLGTTEDDLDDVVFEEQDVPSESAVRWMAIARVHTPKNYN